MKLTILFATLLTLIAAFDSSAVYASGMQDDVDQAVSIIQRFESIPEHSIPPAGAYPTCSPQLSVMPSLHTG